jgi:hypothetical protein
LYRSAIVRTDDDGRVAVIGRLKDLSDQMARQRAALDLLLDPETRAEVLTAAEKLRDACGNVVTRAEAKDADLEGPIGTVSDAIDELLSRVRKDIPPAFK